MFLKSLSLQNFRSYTKQKFTFNKETTLVVGPNTSGKTNLLEAIYLLSTGKSFHAEKDIQTIQFGKELAKIKGEADVDGVNVSLEVVITPGMVAGIQAPNKKYLVNGVAKRRVDFSGNLICVLFSPLDLEIINLSPGIRRDFLDEVLEQTDREYRLAVSEYVKGIRQRNALLDLVKETGKRSVDQFEYWDEIVIRNGQLVTQKREAFIEFVNNQKKDVFDFIMLYDKSIISEERLRQYKNAEEGSGVTLVGPHRDDFSMQMKTNGNTANESEFVDIKYFGSRGQQRLVVLQLKMLQLIFMEKSLGLKPLLLLDDIFSELDGEHINLVLEETKDQQTIMTTTHKEFIPKALLKIASPIEL